MKTFSNFLTEAENSIPLDLSEAVEWFNIFDEELSEVNKIEVIEGLTNKDLINLVWLKEYLEEDYQSSVQRQRRQQKALSKKVQGRNLDPSGKPIRIQPYQRTYHGTSKTASQGIDKTGFKDDVNVTRQARGRGVYTSPDKDVASRYAADRSKKFDPTPGEGKIRTFKVPKSQLPPEKMTYQGVGDPKNKGYKTYLLKTQQADKFDVTNDPKETAKNLAKRLLKKSSIPQTPQQGPQQGPVRPISDLKISRSGLEAARDVARGRNRLPDPPPGVPRAPYETSSSNLRQSLKSFGSAIERVKNKTVGGVKNVAGKVINAPAAAGTAVGNVVNKQLQKVPGVRPAQAANLRMNRAIGSKVSNIKSAIKTGATKVPGGTRALGVVKGAGSFASKAVVPLDFALNVYNRKSQGQSLKRSVAGGATQTVGGLAGAQAGAALGTAIAPGVGTLIGGGIGYFAGSGLAGKAFDTAAGKTPQQIKADQIKNRQRQSGGALTGIGGKTTFSKGKGGTGFMSTGVGNQRRTVQLAKTSVVKDPKTGKLETGNLAFKGGKAVYKRAADPSSLAQTSSNPLERVGRSLFAGAYKQQDEKARQAKLKQAVQSDIKRQQALGVKGSQNLVGPKIVGTKIVGPKPKPYDPGGGRQTANQARSLSAKPNPNK